MSCTDIKKPSMVNIKTIGLPYILYVYIYTITILYKIFCAVVVREADVCRIAAVRHVFLIQGWVRLAQTERWMT